MTRLLIDLIGGQKRQRKVENSYYYYCQDVHTSLECFDYGAHMVRLLGLWALPIERGPLGDGKLISSWCSIKVPASEKEHTEIQHYFVREKVCREEKSRHHPKPRLKNLEYKWAWYYKLVKGGVKIIVLPCCGILKASP